MASLSSPGIGSGLDVNGLVTQLVAAAKTAPQNAIDKRRDTNGAELSAIGSLKSALSAFQDSLSSLADGSAFAQFLATASSTDHFSAIADATAAAGTYSVDVQQLATAEKASSGAFAANTALSTGQLTITVGTQSMTVAVGTSLLIIVVNSAAGFAAHAGDTTLDYRLTAVFTLAAIGGSLAAAPLATRLPADRLRRWFAYLVFAIAAFVVIQALLHPTTG